MRPGTKLQVRVHALSKSLPKISNEQEEWAFKNMLNHLAYRTKKKTGCLDCGHVWASNDNRLLITKLVDTHVNCPACGTRLTIEDTRKKYYYQNRQYMSILDVREEFQIVRIFELWSQHKVGQPANWIIREVIQQFIIPNGKHEVVALNRSFSYYHHGFHGTLEIRQKKDISYKYDLWTNKMYPIIKVLPIYKRNGFKSKIDGVSAYLTFKNILNDPISETLIKAKQYGLLAARSGDKAGAIHRFWDSIKICLRAKYKIKGDDVITWLDYLELLAYFKKDLRNQVYVCPKDLKKAHNKLTAKKQAILKHEQIWNKYTDLVQYFNGDINKSLYNKPVPLQLEINRLDANKTERERQLKLKRERKKIDEAQEAYIKTKGAFFGIGFTNGNLTVCVLESVEDFFNESELLKHCCFANGYYKKPDSLCLSARIDGIPVETVEVSLADFKILQARGLYNNPSPYNKQIIDLVSKNLPIIRKKYKELKNVAA